MSPDFEARTSAEAGPGEDHKGQVGHVQEGGGKAKGDEGQSAENWPSSKTSAGATGGEGGTTGEEIQTPRLQPGDAENESCQCQRQGGF